MARTKHSDADGLRAFQLRQKREAINIWQHKEEGLFLAEKREQVISHFFRSQVKGGGNQGAGSRTLPSSNSSPVHSVPPPPHTSKIILPLIKVGEILIFFYELIVKCNSLLCVNSNKWVFSSQYNKHHYIFNPPSPPHSPPPQIWKLLILIADSVQTEYCPTFLLFVCSFVCHRRDISHFSHI